MGPRELHPGSDVDAMCTRCKALSGHIIVAMVGTTIVKVKCNTCGSEHRFKPVTPEKRPPAVTRSRSGQTAPARGRTSADGEDTGEFPKEYKPKVKPARAPASGKDSSVAKAGGKSGKNQPDPAELFAQAFAGKEGNPVHNYSPRQTYAKDDLVQHPAFGVGVVLANRDGGKMDVLFPSGARTLVHART